MTKVTIRPLEVSDAEELLVLRLRNRRFFQPFEPIREEAHFTLKGQIEEIERSIQGATSDQSYIFGIFEKETDALAGRIALTGIARGPFQNANVGYYIDEACNGKGYATEAVRLCVKRAFEQLGLHRVQAGVMPRNKPSIRVLEKAGFRREGLALNYLKINGQWKEHVLYAVTVEDLM